MEKITWAAILAKLGPMSDPVKPSVWSSELMPNSDQRYPTVVVNNFNNFEVKGNKNGQSIHKAFFTAAEAEQFLEQEWPLG